LERNDLFKEVEIIPVNSAYENSAAKWITQIYIPVKKKMVVINVKPVIKDSLNTIIPSNIKTPKP
ncbi:MAG: AraC family transcriptional regulator, partial [Flavobacterium sp.]